MTNLDSSNTPSGLEEPCSFCLVFMDQEILSSSIAISYFSVYLQNISNIAYSTYINSFPIYIYIYIYNYFNQLSSHNCFSTLISFQHKNASILIQTLLCKFTIICSSAILVPCRYIVFYIRSNKT
jgi:hypothetical protein